MTTTLEREYTTFLAGKRVNVTPSGFDVISSYLNRALFDFQKHTVIWALKKGRAAIFQDTGLGKTIQEMEIAAQVALFTGLPVLILAPLAVANQTVREGAKFGYEVNLCKSQEDVLPGINITNYEKLHLFNLELFGGIILDESSILKAYAGKTTQEIIERSRVIPYRYAFTATPAPNDHEELGNHAEFLGIMSRTEMLSTYFVHDGGDTSKWRLKGHAEAAFWRWVAKWGVAMKNPSDLGYDGMGYVLPPLNPFEHCLEVENVTPTNLFAVEARTFNEKKTAKRLSLTARVRAVRDLVVAEPQEQWLIWCELNDEGDALEKAIEGAVQVAGRHSDEFKTQAVIDFLEGRTRVLISKSSIFGFGLNLQNCARIAFVGVSDSFEQTYQAIRRCWRFGQTRPVDVHLVYGEAEAAIVRNLARKQADADKMSAGMLDAMRHFTNLNPSQTTRETEEYLPSLPMILPAWIGAN